MAKRFERYTVVTFLETRVSSALHPINPGGCKRLRWPTVVQTGLLHWFLLVQCQRREARLAQQRIHAGHILRGNRPPSGDRGALRLQELPDGGGGVRRRSRVGALDNVAAGQGTRLVAQLRA